MDAIDILGGLLGGKSGGAGGLGGKILKDILTGGSRGSTTSRPSPSRPDGPSTSSSHGRGRSESRPRGVNIDAQAEALEDLLNVASSSSKQSGSSRSNTSNREQRPSSERSHETAPTFPKTDARGNQRRDHTDHPSKPSGGFQFPVDPAPERRPPMVDPLAQDRESQNQRALVLIRAMVNATKSDGKLSSEEQQRLFEQLGDTSPDAVRFLQNEFNQPLNVREFAWSIPLGMEEQVYTISLASIELDEQREADYLKELAHGLRLSAEVCNAIHQRHNAPLIF